MLRYKNDLGYKEYMLRYKNDLGYKEYIVVLIPIPIPLPTFGKTAALQKIAIPLTLFDT